MSDDRKRELMLSYLRRAWAEGKPGKVLILQKLRDNFEAVRAEARADIASGVLDRFLYQYGTEPQSLRALNLLAEKKGYDTRYTDGTITHAAPETVQ